MSSSTGRQRMLQAAERGGLALTAAISALVAALYAVAAAFAAAARLAEDAVEVSSMELVNAATPEFAEKSEAITQAHYENVTITVEGLPMAVRWWLVAEVAVVAVGVVGVCLAVIWLCLRTLRGRPFGRSVSMSVGIAAVLVMASGLVGQFLSAVARAEVVQFLGESLTGGANGSGPYEGFPLFAFSLDLTPLGVGLALAAVAGAFEFGERLQRDTEGLV